MKTILDSIIKVEQNLQKQRMDAQKEADEIKNEAKKKSIAMEKQIEEEYEKKRIQRRDQIEKESEAYAEKLLKQAQVDINKRKQKISNKKETIKKRIINTVLDEAKGEE